MPNQTIWSNLMFSVSGEFSIKRGNWLLESRHSRTARQAFGSEMSSPSLRLDTNFGNHQKNCNVFRINKHVCCHLTLQASVNCDPDERQTRREEKDMSQSNFNSISISPQCSYYQHISPEHTLANPFILWPAFISSFGRQGESFITSCHCDIVVAIKTKHPHRRHQREWRHLWRAHGPRNLQRWQYCKNFVSKDSIDREMLITLTKSRGWITTRSQRLAWRGRRAQRRQWSQRLHQSFERHRRCPTRF